MVIGESQRRIGVQSTRQACYTSPRLWLASWSYARGRDVCAQPYESVATCVRVPIPAQCGRRWLLLLRERRALRAREPDFEAGASAGTLTAGADPPAVQLHHSLHDRQAQAESPLLAARGRFLLAERIEHMRQELRADANAGIRHGKDELGVLLIESYRYPPPDRRTLLRLSPGSRPPAAGAWRLQGPPPLHPGSEADMRRPLARAVGSRLVTTAWMT